jgi:hypothetical protein
MAVPIPATGTESGSEFHLRPKEAQELLRGCFGQYRAKLVGLARTSLEMSADLFEGNTFVTDTDVQDFRLKRPDWVARFERTIVDLFEKRIAGAKRKGRRPDYDASLASLRVLTAFDHEKQAALTAATSFLLRLTRRELDALDLRTEVLLPETGPRDTDNPFAPAYILDAIGSTSRAVYPNSRVWRPLMERMLTDLTPTINKIYITLNRYLADHHVLPEIKAALRIRSEHRPEDDRELLPAFSKLFAEAATSCRRTSSFRKHWSIRMPRPRSISTTQSPVPHRRRLSAPPAATMASPAILAGLEALARLATPRPVPGAAAAGAPGEFPDLDPLMALGTSTPLFATLGQWQRVDLRTALADAAPQPDGGEVAMVPLNLIPHIRTAIAGQIENPTDRITVDVIALLFDYIFRDPSIPDSLRNLFGRLQVPIVKAALLDRTFFSDKRHPARLLLDHLADAAVGAQNDEGYRAGLELMATGVIDDLSRNFEIDVSIFRGADDTLTAFIESERARPPKRCATTSPRRWRRGRRGGPICSARDDPRQARRARPAVRCPQLCRDDLGGLHGVGAQGARRGEQRVECGARHARRSPVEHCRQGAHGAEGAVDEDDPDANRRAAQGNCRAAGTRRARDPVLRRDLQAAHGGDQAETRAVANGRSGGGAAAAGETRARSHQRP